MSNNTSYDKALLDEAPEVTREQRQRFYDADLLRDDANGQHTTDASGGRDLETGNGAARSKEYASLPPSTTLSSPSTPWYKTRKGIIGLVILAIVIIAAVIGGAVGGTQANKSSNDNDDSSGLLTASDSASQLPPSISASSEDASTETQGEEGSGTIGVATATPTTSPPDDAPVGTAVTPAPPEPSSDEGISDAAAAIVGQGRL